MWSVHVASALQITLIDTVLAEIFPFPLQDKIALIKVEKFEIPLPRHAVAILSEGDTNQRKTVKTSYN